jgi:hypothetical protein
MLELLAALVRPAQAAPPPPAGPGGPSAATVFYLTLLLIFVTAVVTAVLTKWARDKCLSFFHGYHVTLERTRGQTTWGRLKVFSTGLEILYDKPYVDVRGRKKTSYLMYQQDVEQNLLSLLRYHDDLDAEAKSARDAQVRRTFNPGPVRRAWRGVRNLVNTLRDAFNAAIGAVVGQYQRASPAGAILATQGASVTTIGQTLLGRFANAYEPLLEQYIGRQVILDVADPLNPNNATVQYDGYLADYTQHYIAVFNVGHESGGKVELALPDVERGEPLPPPAAPPPPGGPPPATLPAPLACEHGLAVRLDGSRMKVQNTRADAVIVRRLTREGFEPLELGAVVPPNATLDLPARDARGGRLAVEIARCLDVVAPRKLATVRHAGKLAERRGLVDEFNLERLPLVPRFWPAAGRGERHGGGRDGAADRAD